MERPGGAGPGTSKRPSITEAELTPIVVSQLHNTKKHKDEQRRARRGSAAGRHGSPAPAAAVVSDSGAESCSEEARLRTAEVFMTGIQSALQPQEDIVSEVESVLGKLMASLQRGAVASSRRHTVTYNQ